MQLPFLLPNQRTNEKIYLASKIQFPDRAKGKPYRDKESETPANRPVCPIVFSQPVKLSARFINYLNKQ